MCFREITPRVFLACLEYFGLEMCLGEITPRVFLACPEFLLWRCTHVWVWMKHFQSVPACLEMCTCLVLSGAFYSRHVVLEQAL
jgi:hypothetical protein